MSGGHLCDYAQYRINDIAGAVKRLIDSNDDKTLNDWGETKGRGYSTEVIEEFKEGLHFLKLAEIYTNRIDWLYSGDDGEDCFLRRLKEDLDGC